MYTYRVATAPKTSVVSSGIGTWGIIAFVLALVGGILVYTLFLSKKNEGKFTGFTKWLYEFLGFKNLTIEVLLKVCYLVSAIYVTLMSFGFIGSSAIAFFGFLIVGNLVLRLAFEGALLLILVYKNVKEINEKTK